MKFDNHHPINLEKAEVIAFVHRDGGAYSGIGYRNYDVYQGYKVHLVYSYSSGCEYNNNVATECEYVGKFDSREDLIQYLLTQDPCWWSNSLLTRLGYQGEDA